MFYKIRKTTILIPRNLKPTLVVANNPDNIWIVICCYGGRFESRFVWFELRPLPFLIRICFGPDYVTVSYEFLVITFIIQNPPRLTAIFYLRRVRILFASPALFLPLLLFRPLMHAAVPSFQAYILSRQLSYLPCCMLLSWLHCFLCSFHFRSSFL